MIKRYKLISCVFLTMAVSLQGVSQPISENSKTRLIEAISEELKMNYVMPSVVDSMVSLLDQRFEIYSDTPKELAAELSKDLYSISHDGHLVVTYDPNTYDQVVNPVNEQKPTNPWLIEDINNFGVRGAQMLNGRIGYLKLTSFYPGSEAREVLIAALNYLSNSESLIVDLRNNGGGSSYTLKLFSSYFFEPDVILGASYWRPSDQITKSYSEIYVPGKRLSNMPVYVLTSGRTYSAAEAFSQMVKDHKRGVVIGERTGGGAHSGNTVALCDGFIMYISKGKPVDPTTDWEGIGVIPDYEIEQESALFKAHQLALDSLVTTRENNGRDPKVARWYLEGLNATPIRLTEESLRKYTGNYGDVEISMYQDDLYFQQKKKLRFKMTPIGEFEFILKEDDFKKVVFLGNEPFEGIQVESLINKEKLIKSSLN